MTAVYQKWLFFFHSNDLNPNQAHLLADYANTLESRGLPVIFEINHLSKLLGVELSLLSRITGVSNKFYRSFFIPKKSGDFRTIKAPYPKLAYIQKWIKTNILEKLEVNEHAFAYRKGRSNIDNAKQHVGSSELLKLDLTNFFHDISIKQVRELFRDLGYSDKVSYQLAKLCCLKGHIPQGAPTSPIISNLVLRKLDIKLSCIARNQGLIYSRYADDIFFSGLRVTETLVNEVKKTIEEFDFSINNKKFKVLRCRERKIITGLCVSSNRVRVPKKQRREYRKSAYYLIKNGVEQFNGERGELNPLYIDEIIGKGSYILTVEPENEYVRATIKQLALLKKKLLIGTPQTS